MDADEIARIRKLLKRAESNEELAEQIVASYERNFDSTLDLSPALLRKWLVECIATNLREVAVAVRKRFDSMRRAPLQFASTREAFVAQLALLLVLDGRDGKSLYMKFLREPGTCAAIGLTLDLDETFAQQVLSETERLFREKVPPVT